MFKHLLRRFSALILFGAICTCGAYYYLGYFDFSFIDRNHVLGGEVYQPPNQDVYDTDPYNPSDPDDMDPDKVDEEYNQALMSAQSGNLSDVDNAETTRSTDETTSSPIPNPVPSESFFKNISEYKESGYKLTNTIFDQKTHVLGEVTLSVELTENYSNSLKTISYPIKSYASSDSEYVISYEMRRTKRPAIDLYMGCIFYDNGNAIYLLSTDGKPISKFDVNKYIPAYTRDINDNPVFYSYTTVTDESGAVSAVKSYYILSEDKKSLISSDYNDITDNRGIYSDYPSYYGKSISGYPERVYNANGTWSYNGIWGSYASAYKFTSDYACVADARGEMTIINQYGQSAFTTRNIVPNAVNRYVTEIVLCVMPASFGEETTGFFYFDHGLIRIREQRLEYSDYRNRRKKTVIYDEEKLYKTDGTEFKIPYGYNIVSYSNGIILLEKDERYGYMNYTGAWIAQPIYTNATTFSEGLAVLTLSNGKMGMIDTKGNIIVPFQYDHISNPSSGIISIYNNSTGWQLLQKMSK